MTKEMDPIPYSEFSENMDNFFEQVSRESKEILIENEKGEQFVLKQAPNSTRRKRPHTEADRQAFLASLGSWKDEDVDQFLKNNKESREWNIRPPVDL